MNKSKEYLSNTDTSDNTSASDSESSTSDRSHVKNDHKNSSEDTDSEDTDSEDSKNSENTEASKDSKKNKDKIIKIVPPVATKPKRKQRLNNFSKHSSKCHPSKIKLSDRSNGTIKSRKCFYCERNRHTFSPFAKRPFKTPPKICEGCTDTQIYEYMDEELNVNCYTYCSPHCNQCVRLKEKRHGKVCCKEITMDCINAKKNNVIFDKILLHRLKDHTITYLSKCMIEPQSEHFNHKCFYCKQGSKLYNSILYEEKKLSFCDQRHGLVYSYTEMRMRGESNRDDNKYYAYYSKKCSDCMYKKNNRDVVHNYLIDGLSLNDRDNVTQSQDEKTINENEKRISQLLQKEQREQKELYEYEKIERVLLAHRYKYKQFPEHEYDCSGSCPSKGYPIETDYPRETGHEIIIPKLCYYCDNKFQNKACGGCLASMYTYSKKDYSTEDESEIMTRLYTLYSSNCEKCLKGMKENNGTEHRIGSDEKLSFEDILNQDNALRTKRKEHEKKISDKLKKKQLKIWRIRVYGLLKIHREQTTQTHSKQCIERKCYGCACAGFEGHSSWCKGKSEGCYYCEQHPGRYLHTQYTSHSSVSSWPTFCDACPASMYDYTKSNFCSYFNNQITISYFKYYTKGCTGCEMFKKRHNGVEVTEDMLSAD